MHSLVLELIMNEALSVGQKVSFGVVIVFLLALSSSPFMTQNNVQDSSTSIDDGMKNAHRVVAIR